MKRYHSTWPYDEVTRADYDGCAWEVEQRSRQYAADTIRLADQPPARLGPPPPRRSREPRWGDDITDPINDPSIPTQAQYMAAVAAHRRRNT